jgi:hypothetical protein
LFGFRGFLGVKLVFGFRVNCGFTVRDFNVGIVGGFQRVHLVGDGEFFDAAKAVLLHIG